MYISCNYICKLIYAHIIYSIHVHVKSLIIFSYFIFFLLFIFDVIRLFYKMIISLISFSFYCFLFYFMDFITHTLFINDHIFKNNLDTLWCFFPDFLFGNVLFLSSIFSVISASSILIVFNFLFLAHICSTICKFFGTFRKKNFKFLFLWEGIMLFYPLLSFLSSE